MSVQSKVESYLKSSEGKQLLNNTLKEYRKSGKKKTAAGDDIVDKNKALELAEELRKMIVSTANNALSGESRHSVRSDVSSLAIDGWHEELDNFVVELSFGADLSRQSLYGSLDEGGTYSNPTGVGIDNIIALFNNGVDGAKTVYGYWVGHSMRTAYGDMDGAWVESKSTRPALQFMQKAVDEFNSKYGAKYNVKATLSSVYD